MPTHDDVDGFLTDTLIGDDPILDAALSAQQNAGLPAIEVSPVSAKLLHLQLIMHLLNYMKRLEAAQAVWAQRS